MYKLIFTLTLLIACALNGLAQINTPVQLKHLSTYHTAIFDESAAEIVQYDELGQRVYFTNAFDNTIEVRQSFGSNTDIMVNRPRNWRRVSHTAASLSGSSALVASSRIKSFGR